MKRYKVILGVLEDHPAISKAKMDEDPNGEWVRWGDVKKIVTEVYADGWDRKPNKDFVETRTL